MHEVDNETFARQVLDAIDGLPPEYRQRLANVDVQVEDWAPAEDYARTRTPRGSTLLGVYRGVPITRRSSGYGMITPDTIVLFRGPIQRISRDEGDLRRNIERVVRHEIAHHFGISDERLHELDAY